MKDVRYSYDAAREVKDVRYAARAVKDVCFTAFCIVCHVVARPDLPELREYGLCIPSGVRLCVTVSVV